MSSRNKIAPCWVPAHVEIHGNERADRRAKVAAVQPCEARFPLPHINSKPNIRSHLRDEGREHLYEESSWMTSVHPNQQKEVVLARLRIGHTRLTCGSMTAKIESCCEGCQEPLTVAHVVEIWAALSDQRRMHLPPNIHWKMYWGRIVTQNVFLLCLGRLIL